MTQGQLPAIQELYLRKAVPHLMQKYGLKNAHQAPRIEKVVLNMGVGKGAEDIKIVEMAQQELSTITGQHAVITRSKKAISNFKIRQNAPVGCRVTLRRRRMYEFLERLICVALPRVRDFRGLSPRGFDEAGNFSFGISEQNIFPELETDKIARTQGMDVTIVIGGGSKEMSRELLNQLGVPFRTRVEKPAAAAAAATSAQG